MTFAPEQELVMSLVNLPYPYVPALHSTDGSPVPVVQVVEELDELVPVAEDVEVALAGDAQRALVAADDDPLQQLDRQHRAFLLLGKVVLGRGGADRTDASEFVAGRQR